MRGAGVDSGTQSTKATIYDASTGELLAVGTAANTVETPADGWAEQDIAQVRVRWCLQVLPFRTAAAFCFAFCSSPC